MNKNIKDYLPYYLGCEVWYQDKLWDLVGVSKPYKTNDTMFVDVDLRPEGKGFRTISYVSSSFTDLSLIKLRLRPLSSMTEEEASAIFQIHRNNDEELGGDDFYIQKQDHGFIITRLDLTELHLMVSFKSGEVYIVEDVPKQKIQPARNLFLITKYLLSLHFDLFGLIDAGLAIDKNKSNQP